MERLRKISLALFLAAFSLFMAATTVFAVPACPDPAPFKQPDGTVIEVNVRGDEFLGWTEDSEGNLIVFDMSTNSYRYARWTDDGPVSTGYAVGGARPGSTGASKGGDVPQKVLDKANKLREKETAALARDDFALSDLNLSEGAPPVPASASSLKRSVLIVHVTWSDRTGINTPKLTGSQIYNLVFSSTGNSVNRYYKELIGTTEDIILPATVNSPLNGSQGVVEITLSGKHTNPQNNSSLSSAVMSSAITQACSQGLVNLKNFDANNNGTLETTELSIGFIVDGYESSAGAPAPSFWGVSTTGTPSSSQTNGVKIASYFGQGAFHRTTGNSSNDMLTVGIICHELGHSGYGFQDTYDYGTLVSPSSRGHGYWSLMSSGSWGNKSGEYAGATPCYADAYNLVRSKFMTPGTVSDYETITLSSHQDIYVVNTPNSKQYFLLQQRKYGSTDNYDRGGFYRISSSSNSSSGGLMIYHIDEAVTLTRINDKPGHYRAAIEEAQGATQNLQFAPLNYGAVANLWGSANTEFSASSSPSSHIYGNFTNNLTPPTLSPSGVTVTAIQWNSSAGTTTFTMTAVTPTPPPPTPTPILTPTPTPITSAAISGLVAPALLETPVSAGALSTADPGYTITSLAWSPSHSPFAGSTVYTASIVLTSKADYQFVSALTPSVNVGTPAAGSVSGSGSGNTLTFAVTFPATAPPFIYGDVNGDGNVNMSDLFILARHIANWPGYEANTLNMLAADVNDDGKVNMSDLFILARHIANWPGYETFPWKASAAEF